MAASGDTCSRCAFPSQPGAGARGRGPQAAAATRVMRAPHSVWLARAGARGAPRADADQVCLHHNHEATAGAHSGGGEGAASTGNKADSTPRSSRAAPTPVLTGPCAA